MKNICGSIAGNCPLCSPTSCWLLCCFAGLPFGVGSAAYSSSIRGFPDAGSEDDDDVESELNSKVVGWKTKTKSLRAIAEWVIILCGFISKNDPFNITQSLCSRLIHC